VAIGLLIVLFLWFRPQGVLPERRRRTAVGRPGSVMPNEDVVTLAWHRAGAKAVSRRPFGTCSRTA